MNLLSATAAFLAALGGAAWADGALEGEWRAVGAQRDGAPAGELIGHVLTVSGDAFRIVDPAGALLYGGRIAADPLASPAAIDFALTEGAAAGATWLGVYAAAERSLVIADNAPDPSRPRPTGFDGGEGYVVVTFDRAE